jgi:hypothetical protein
MGMFDEVRCTCPVCQKGVISWQSKAGDCELHDYDIELVPVEIAKDIQGTIEVCSECGARFTIERFFNIDKVPMFIRKVD